MSPLENTDKRSSLNYTVIRVHKDLEIRNVIKKQVHAQNADIEIAITCPRVVIFVITLCSRLLKRRYEVRKSATKASILSYFCFGSGFSINIA